MGEEKQINTTIFQGVLDAINGGKKKTPEMPHSAQFSTKNNGNGLISNDDNPVEEVQQQFLDWQVNKVGHNLYQRTLYFDTDRITAYQDYRAMDMSPEISAALNIIKDECLTRNSSGNILEIYSENERVKDVLKDLFKKRLNIEYNLRLWIRDLVKYGDYFVHLHIDKKEGIYSFKTFPVEEMHREEGYENKPDSVRFRWETTGDYFEEWQIAHFRLIEDTKKIPYGRCLKYDTYIDTINGPKFIKDITKKDIIWTFNTKTQIKESSKVLDVICSGEKEIYKIRTKNNEIESSKEHNLMICENGEFIYKSVLDLKLNDLLVINNKIDIGENIKINKNFNFTEQNYNGYRNTSFNIPNFVDEDFAKLFGFMLGDGWISNNAVYIALGVDEDINKEYVRLLKKFSCKEIKFKINPNKEGALEYSQAWVNSKMLKEILILNGFVGKCWEKRLPSWIFKAKKNIKESLIQGLIDSDGSINVDEWNCKRYSIELVSEYLIKDIKYLLQTMGRKCGKICSRKRKNTKIWDIEYKKRRTFYIYFYDSYIKQISNYDLKCRKNSDFIITPIIFIEKTSKKEYVYDIHVESENHNFYANGIIVHNSILDSARKLWKQLQLAEDSMLVYRLCLVGETRIRTNNGYKYIKDIVEGDTVLSYNEQGEVEPSKVVYHVNNGKKKLLRIKSKHNEIVCTETHPILVNTNGLIHYVDAKDLVIKRDKLINVNTKNYNIQEKKIERIYNEKVAKLNKDAQNLFKENQTISKLDAFRKISKKHNYDFNRIKGFAYSENKAIPYEVAVDFCEENGFNINDLQVLNKGEIHFERLNLPEYVTEDFARLFGFLFGDGSVKKTSFGFSAGIHKDINERYFNLLKKYFGVVTFQQENRSKIKGVGKYWVNSKVGADILRNLGMNDLHTKIRIPNWIFNLPPEKRKAFVLGFSDADGCERYTARGTWFSTIEISNKRLTEDIKELWHSIGLCAGILKTRKRKGGHFIEEGRKMPDTISYQVTISELELLKYENVLSIEDAGEDFVYDITVDNKLHNFIANCVPAHNTRAPERRVFYIDVGNLQDADVKQYIMKMQNQIKKSPIVDSRTGNINMKYNPMNITEDFFIPLRKDVSSRIDTLPGACLALDTKIELLDGRSLELKDIIKEYDLGKELWSYSINPKTGEIVPGIITWAGITRKNTDVVKITLNNGENIVVTPDHKFNTRFNGIKEVKNLLENESLWSFNKQFQQDFEKLTKDTIITKRTIVSIEYLQEKQDTGTITIDGDEKYHNFHNFALSCGVFTKNSNMADIADINYLQNKLFASLQVPKAYLNYAENLPGGSTLSQADLRFSRTINGIQESVIMELRRIANIHLYFAGFADDIDNFSLSLTNPSTQQELMKLEIQKARLEVAKEYYSPDAFSFASWTWVMENILEFSKADIKLMLKQKKIEKKIFAEIDSAVDTYKKIGLFNDLDSKYEIPGAVPNSEETEKSEGSSSGVEGGGSVLKGLDNLSAENGEIGGGSAEEIGGNEENISEPSPITPEPTTTEPTNTPLSEVKKHNFKKLFKESDDRFGNYLDDLFENNNENNKKSNDTSLIKNNNKLNYKTQKLFERIKNNINSINSKSELIGENVLENNKNEVSLFYKNQILSNQTNDMIVSLENLFKSKNIENEAMDVEDIIEINEENMPEDGLSNEEEFKD